MGGCCYVRMTAVVLWACAAMAIAQRSAALMSAAVAEAEGQGVRTGVAAIEIDGTWRYRHRQDERFVPASNMKLLSAAAVLHGLGHSYEFGTRFELRQGRLVVHAGGDPNLITGTEHGPEALWRGLVSALIQRGVRSVRAVELQQGVFTGPGRPATWPQDQLDTYYCAPTGGFVLEQGTFRLQVRPAGATAEALLVAPFLDMPVDGSIAVVAAKKGAVYGAMDLGDRLRVQGKMWKGSTQVVTQTAVRDPLPWFERGVLQALAQGGIRVTADAAAIDVPELYRHRTPLQPALVRMLEESSNFDAEQLVRVLGAELSGDGSLQGGLAAVRATLDGKFGGAGEALVQIDGSGLSRGNEVTPRLLVTALREIVASRDADMFLAALPVGGETGTLSGRFQNSPVRGRVQAKTGWIRGASSLSGILQRKDGSRCAFAILMNYDPRKDGVNRMLKTLQERIVEALDRGASDG